uniref:Uncharacterized protein n=1 Tax=viral metagenome TaxID=1070528 RepID=A0A6C0ERU2_9ZZZZ
MAVPEQCKDVEKKFQDEVKTFPDLPANIQMNDNRRWNYFKEQMVIGIGRGGAHEAHIREWKRWTHVTDLYMYYNVYPEIMKYLWRYTNCKETDPFTEVIKQYALRVNNAHNAVINCIRVKAVNAVPGKAAPAAAPPPPPPPPPPVRPPPPPPPAPAPSAPPAPPPVAVPGKDKRVEYPAGTGFRAAMALRRGGRTRKTKRRARKTRRHK